MSYQHLYRCSEGTLIHAIGNVNVSVRDNMASMVSGRYDNSKLPPSFLVCLPTFLIVLSLCSVFRRDQSYCGRGQRMAWLTCRAKMYVAAFIILFFR